MKKHEWKETTEDGVRIYCATFHGGRWAMRSRLKKEEEWTYHNPMELPELRLLREVLFRKYQRQRIPFKQLEQIDGMIEELEKLEPKSAPDDEAAIEGEGTSDVDGDGTEEGTGNA